jgi:hypothetical protein
MGGLQGRDDAFQLTEYLKGLQGLLIGNRGVIDTSHVPKMSMLGPDGRIV